MPRRNMLDVCNYRKTATQSHPIAPLGVNEIALCRSFVIITRRKTSVLLCPKSLQQADRAMFQYDISLSQNYDTERSHLQRTIPDQQDLAVNLAQENAQETHDGSGIRGSLPDLQKQAPIQGDATDC
jgi:hypothetical protein